MTTDISLQLTISDKSDKGLTGSWWPTIFFGHTQNIHSCLPAVLSNSSASETHEEKSYSSTTTIGSYLEQKRTDKEGLS
jgi:hypothetical protein